MRHDFPAVFRALTGQIPFDWQCELYAQLRGGETPAVCDLPTGVGKTMVIAIWLIALGAQAAEGALRLPRRLVYVVNRRTIVDQSTGEAEKLRERLGDVPELEAALRGLCAFPLGDEPPLAISTLRGQFADDGEWAADPARPAIIVGTVDMIGSRLLFGGYRMGFKSRPLHAGFLGQDALLVHDEAHLEPAFQCLLETICAEQVRERTDLPWPKLRVLQLSATARKSGESGVFTLTDAERNPPQEIPEESKDDPTAVVWQRLKAPKTLRLHAGDEKSIDKTVADLALQHRDSQSAVLVFLRSVEHVEKVCTALSKELKKANLPENVAALTGTIRGYERDKLAAKDRVFARFLPEDHRSAEPATGAAFLVCTSAGEVGVNISADHMVCDLSTFDSMAQRLGRVNRFGERDDSRIDVVHPQKFDTSGKQQDLEERREKTLQLLKRLDGDASPLALMKPDAAERQAAFAPEPDRLTATDILFDAWAMTSIRGAMPGRPELAPYLHGIAENVPQITIAWRAELDLIDRKLSNVENRKALRAILAKHQIRPHETLTVGMSNERGKWKFRAILFLEAMITAHPDLRDSPVVIQFSHSFRLTTIGELIDKPDGLHAEPTIILPASFGGLDGNGMLTVPKSKSTKNGDTKDTDLEDENGDQLSWSSLDIADIAGYEREKNLKPRRRVVIERSDEGWTVRALPGNEPLPSDWNLEEPPERSTPLVKRIQQKSGLKVRLVQPIKWDEEGDRVRALVCLSAPPNQLAFVEQTLHEHVNMVENSSRCLADALLRNDQVAYAALEFAAKWHDEGKNADIWQHYIGGPDNRGEPLGKSAEWRDPKRLGGYRHEFGSLLRLSEDEINQYFRDPERSLTSDQQRDALDLALHLIAAHHGYGRPHFEHIIDHKFTTQQSEDTLVEVMRRFARLQCKYGRWGLAYLESLLRAADADASRAVGIDPETDDDASDGVDE